jgi:hypothetical protein
MNKRILILGRIMITLFGVIILIMLLGIIFFPRAELPQILTEDYCAQYNIRFDTTSIERIYFDPGSILANPENFLNEDQAYLLLVKSRAKGGYPFNYDAWLNDIEKLASQPEEKRAQQIPFRLYELIMTHQQAFCQEIGEHVLAYLPEGTDLEATIYLTALDEPVPAYTHGKEIAFSLSHPLFFYAAKIHEPTGLSSFFNLALQELHHIGFSEGFEFPSLEEHIENEVVIDMLIGLQIDGMATHIEYTLSQQYPSPFEYFLYLIDKEFIVRRYIKEMNELFAIAKTKPTGEAYDDIYRQIGSLCYRRKGFYILGGYMAMTIESELGREALVQTISGGYEAFAETYNAVAGDGMKILWR